MRNPKTQKRTKAMAEAMLTKARQNGCATERDMLRLGFTAAEIRKLGPAAINLAHRTGGMPYAHDPNHAY
jgi:hypothetical protein